MRLRGLCTAVGLVLAAWGLAGPTLVGQLKPPLPPSAAYRIIELPSGRTLSVGRDDVLHTPVLPGSIVKIATLIAGLESGIITPGTRMLCLRQVEVAGHRVTCSHPDVGRPIGPAEALAHSCNSYFGSIATRLRRDALDRALAQLGLPRSTPSVPIAAAALGLEGTRMSADQLLAAFVRLTGAGSVVMRDDTRAVVMEGLRGAAEYGTAAAFRDRGVTALAKTGTAPMPGGGFEGLVVAVTPPEHPSRAVVMMVPGAAGADAAGLAADRLMASMPACAASRTAPRVAADPSRGGMAIQWVRVGTARRDGRYDVVTMPLEEYVSRVVGAEAAPSSGAAARQALAIVARTFAVRNRSRHERDGFDLCDLTHCQVVGARTKGGDEAALATSGQALFFAGQLATVFYTASCGGHSERASDVWPGGADQSYLPARAEPGCRAESRWQSDVSASDLQHALVASGRRGQVLRNLAVLNRTQSGRVSRLLIDGFEPAAIAGEEFRLAVGRTLGWQVLKSTLFDVERTAAGYRFRGSGRGHGVGLCVVGSVRMAAGGQSALEILSRYFPGTEVHTAEPAAVPRSGVRLEITVPAGEERERYRVEGLVQAALLEFSARIGVPVPAHVQIVFHPTVEAYTRATGQPWWTAGASRGNHIDLMPLSALKQRGVLEGTLRHEVAHVLTGERLKGRPTWVEEAVAMDLAGDSRAAENGTPWAGFGAPALSCPTDAEWRSIRSENELRKAYRRAAACFAVQRAAGRRWDEIR